MTTINQTRVSFKLDRTDLPAVQAIVDRAMTAGLYESASDASMDVIATHLNGNPLRLAELAVTSRFDFVHDVAGIRDCIDRRTGKMTRGFRPRYSQPEASR